jgi:hypothetical protein
VKVDEKQNFIMNKVIENAVGTEEKILWSLHAVKKLRIEGLRKVQVEQALRDCVIIEDYKTEGRPLPDCLVLGFSNDEPLHLVIAIDEDYDRILIVTVYKPDAERWNNGWKKRKN